MNSTPWVLSTHHRTLLHGCINAEGWTTTEKAYEHAKVDKANYQHELAEMIDYFYGVMGLPS